MLGKTTLPRSVRGAARAWTFGKRMSRRRRRCCRCHRGGRPPGSRQRSDCRSQNPGEHRRTISCRPAVSAASLDVFSHAPLEASEPASAATAASAAAAVVVVLPVLPVARPPPRLVVRPAKRMAPPCPPCERERGALAIAAVAVAVSWHRRGLPPRPRPGPTQGLAALPWASP